jgi:hypothetical protein
MPKTQEILQDMVQRFERRQAIEQVLQKLPENPPITQEGNVIISAELYQQLKALKSA